jgi:hypothetical protein
MSKKTPQIPSKGAAEADALLRGPKIEVEDQHPRG